jgi:hypothetical protein
VAARMAARTPEFESQNRRQLAARTKEVSARKKEEAKKEHREEVTVGKQHGHNNFKINVFGID